MGVAVMGVAVMAGAAPEVPAVTGLAPGRAAVEAVPGPLVVTVAPALPGPAQVRMVARVAGEVHPPVLDRMVEQVAPAERAVLVALPAPVGPAERVGLAVHREHQVPPAPRRSDEQGPRPPRTPELQTA